MLKNISFVSKVIVKHIRAHEMTHCLGCMNGRDERIMLIIDDIRAPRAWLSYSARPLRQRTARAMERQLMRRVATMEWAMQRRFYEVVAICARVMAEIYVALVIREGDRSWSLAEDIWSLPESCMEYDDLEVCRRIGNTGAHAGDEEGMTREAAEQAMAAAMHLASAYIARVRAMRARL